MYLKCFKRLTIEPSPAWCLTSNTSHDILCFRWRDRYKSGVHPNLNLANPNSPRTMSVLCSLAPWRQCGHCSNPRVTTIGGEISLGLDKGQPKRRGNTAAPFFYINLQDSSFIFFRRRSRKFWTRIADTLCSAHS